MARRRTVRTRDVEEALAGLSESHLLCRDFGHTWRPYTAEYVPQRRQYIEALVCIRCKSIRRRLLGEHGELLGNGYTYADGYQVEGVGRLSGDDRDALRLAGLQVVLRMTEDEAAPKSPRRLKAV